MGVQIHITKETLIEAGWDVSTHTEYHTFYNHHEDCFDEEEISYLLIKKDDHVFQSYVDYAFVADCNSWGDNIKMFEKAGLLSIKHTLS